jgi:hypothetical protein
LRILVAALEGDNHALRTFSPSLGAHLLLELSMLLLNKVNEIFFLHRLELPVITV